MQEIPDNIDLAVKNGLKQAKAKQLKPFRSLGRDLYADLKCTCPHKSLGDCGVKTTIKLTGYYDGNFFDNVNNEPKIGKCTCGREYSVQWFREGVEAYFTDNKA